jgi:DNA-binding MarR family transcriptional regulator
MLTIQKRNQKSGDATALPSFSQDLFEAVMRLQREVLRFHARFDFGELSRLHLGALGILSRADALPVSELASKLSVSRPQMTALTDKLVERGLVERGSDPADRRVITLSLTKEGRAVLQKGLDAAHQEAAARLAVLSESDRAALAGAVRTLQKILSKL